MRRQTLAVVVGVLLCGLSGSWCASAGPRFFHAQLARPRSGVPRYDYHTSSPAFVSAVVSEEGISDEYQELVEVRRDQVSSVVIATSRRFVVDDLGAGPILLTDIAATVGQDGVVRVSGVAVHTGGDTGQLLGGKMVIRADVLAAAGPAVLSSPVLATARCESWLRTGAPATVGVAAPLTITVPLTKITRIRLFLEYHPSR